MHAKLVHLRTYWKAIVFYGILLAGGLLLGERFRDFAFPEAHPIDETGIHLMMMVVIGLYVLTSAIPFVPGAEIGFGLLMMFGASAAPFVYGGMVLALVTSFCIARLVPVSLVAGGLHWLGLRRAAGLIEATQERSDAEFLSELTQQAPGKIAKLAIRNRYLLLAAVLNVPGNSVIGGGGGIAFAAGLSGVFSFWKFLGTIALAAAPIPLACAILL